MALVGRDRIAFAFGSGASRIIAIASIGDGRIVRRLPRFKGESIPALAGSPDGKTLFYVSNSQVWTMPTDDGEPRKFHVGDSLAIEPDGMHAVVKLTEKNEVRFVRVGLDGGPEERLPLQREFRPAAAELGPSAVAKDGRIAIRVASRDSWFWPAAILDPRTGRVTLLAHAPDADMRLPGWADDGRLVTVAMAMRSSLWRLQQKK